MEPLIIANWKMNPATGQQAEDLFYTVKEGVEHVKNVKVVVCPPFVYLSSLKGMTLGAQHVFYQESGAYTGEVSPVQLRDLGVTYVIIGHSEARLHLNETDEVINKKVHECIKEGFKIILCVGEKEGEDREDVLERQIAQDLKGVRMLQEVYIAYEPVWAIGTGKNCSVEDTQKAAALIRELTSENMRVLYGGSVTSKNAQDYLKKAGIDGLLVGGDSLNAEDFVKIVRLASV